MRFYSFDSVFSFGRHQGQTIAEVLAENPGYLNFCLQVLDHFALRRHELESWQQQFPKLSEQMTPVAWQKLDEKESLLQAELGRQEAEQEPDEDDWSYHYSNRDADRDTFDALTDGQYGDYDDFGGDMDSLRDAMGY